MAFVYIRTVDIFEQLRADNPTLSEEAFKSSLFCTPQNLPLTNNTYINFKK